MSKEQTLANEEQKLKSANSLNKLYIYIYTHTFYSLQSTEGCFLFNST